MTKHIVLSGMNTNLKTTLLGGQAFNWDYVNNAYYGFTQNGVVKILPKEKDYEVRQYGENIHIDRYFGKDIDMQGVKQSIDKDEYIHNAMESVKNITILRQDFIQTTLSYILATNKNIPAIRQSIRILSNRLGKEMIVDEIKIYTFPLLQSLVQADIPTLKASKIGYRAEYLQKSAQQLLVSDLVQRIPTMEKEETRGELVKLPGVGPKVADCILLYSLGYLDTVPIDIWMSNIAKHIYKVPYNTYKDISNWYTNYFGEYAGIAGQYLFEFYRGKTLAQENLVSKVTYPTK